MNVTEYGIFSRYHCKLAITEALGMSSPKKWNGIGTKYMKKTSFLGYYPYNMDRHTIIA